MSLRDARKARRCGGAIRLTPPAPGGAPLAYSVVEFADYWLAKRRTMSSLGMTSGPRTDSAIQWLLDGDPAIRWQALRDLVGVTEPTVERERRKVARDGWGARLLARQDPKGKWASGQTTDAGLYSPKWTSTTYTMLLL